MGFIGLGVADDCDGWNSGDSLPSIHYMFTLVHASQKIWGSAGFGESGLAQIAGTKNPLLPGQILLFLLGLQVTD